VPKFGDFGSDIAQHKAGSWSVKGNWNGDEGSHVYPPKRNESKPAVTQKPLELSEGKVDRKVDYIKATSRWNLGGSLVVVQSTFNFMGVTCFLRAYTWFCRAGFDLFRLPTARQDLTFPFIVRMSNICVCCSLLVSSNRLPDYNLETIAIRTLTPVLSAVDTG